MTCVSGLDQVIACGWGLAACQLSPMMCLTTPFLSVDLYTLATGFAGFLCSMPRHRRRLTESVVLSPSLPLTCVNAASFSLPLQVH